MKNKKKRPQASSGLMPSTQTPSRHIAQSCEFKLKNRFSFRFVMNSLIPPPTSEQQMNMFRLRDKMSLLNAEFLKVINGYFTEKNHYDFVSLRFKTFFLCLIKDLIFQSGTMKSYMDHVAQLKQIYKVDDDVAADMTVPRRTENSSESSGETVAPRKIAKAVRKNGTPKNPLNSTVFAASSPAATVASVPKFGDISVITKETPAPLAKTAEPLVAPAAPATARKRAIRGGGPLGGAESVVFKSGEDGQAATSSVKIPATTIKFPEPTKDFWTKKSDAPAAPSNSGSLFAFLGKELVYI